jgi:hypothetical protein
MTEKLHCTDSWHRESKYVACMTIIVSFGQTKMFLPVLPLHAGFEGGTNILENIKIKIENVSLCC